MPEHSSEIVHACPECGVELRYTCYHDGEDIRAVDMPATKAAELRRDYAGAVLADPAISILPSGARIIMKLRDGRIALMNWPII